MLCLLPSCQEPNDPAVDHLNDLSYENHYRNLDSTRIYAQQAFDLAEHHYSNGQAEALNHLAFVTIAKMEYQEAYEILQQVKRLTDNQLELLVADVQLMRLCQRESRNREFYSHLRSAQRKLQRIAEERDHLTSRQKHRLAYAESELQIIVSTYYYYLGQYERSAEAIMSLVHRPYLEQDTAQLLNYYYVIGSGGILKGSSHADIRQQEFDYLMRCLLLARQSRLPYWEANSLQAISEHLQEHADELIAANALAIEYINPEGLPEQWLAGNLASRALALFSDYGDVYQTAGAYRTIAQCDWVLKDYEQAIFHLQEALTHNPAIEQAPDLVASIREQLSLAYAAVNDKPQSDYQRNAYLDLQEQTRQDRQLEARAEQLHSSSAKLNTMISIVILAIILTIALFLFFAYLRRQSDSQYSASTLLMPLHEWTQQNDIRRAERTEQMEEIEEQTELVRRQLDLNRKRNLEQRAKVSLANSVIPFIDRIIREIRQLQTQKESLSVQKERYAYMAELTDQIENYNDVLTKWIQMRQGELSLHIESFPLKNLFDILQRGRTSFQMKGITLNVHDTLAIVKADMTLSLFMLNTMVDNARKFTPAGGTVDVSAEEQEDFVEISIADSGIGMTAEEQAHVFDYKPIVDANEPNGKKGDPTSHGFGLMNCRGIIEKYRKVSRIFSVCEIGVESKPHEGSRFFFRLPKGMVRMLVLLAAFALGVPAHLEAQTVGEPLLDSARMMADSVYFSNVNGQYEKALLYAHSCIELLNRHHALAYPSDTVSMAIDTAEEPAELHWWQARQETDFSVVLDVRNEIAVAAMALHQWSLYHYNNRAYTQLFRERSADPTLAAYVNVMQLSEINKNVAMALLVMLLLLLFPAYYFLYYRHRLHHRFLIEQVRTINQMLLSDQSAQEKLDAIDRLWTHAKSDNKDLEAVVDRIRHSLQQAVESERLSNDHIEQARDELRRVHYESDRLHIANSVLDNCLSTLKHETMYYPSRIRLLIEDQDTKMETLNELTRYYKELYAILATQANRQTESPLHIDDEMLAWLFRLLTRQNAGEKPEILATSSLSGCVRITLLMTQLHLSADQCSQLFTPLTMDMDYLLCRQIVREMGEENNARACGILAHLPDGNLQGTIIELTITERIWKNSKLSS